MENLEPKVAREVAEQQFNRFCADMDIDHDTEKMDEKDAEGFTKHRETLLVAMMDGRLVLNDDSELVLTPKRGRVQNPITFREPDGATFMAMDRKKNGQDMGKLIALMDEMTKSTPGTCSKLKNVDFKVAQAIVTLFLA